jgi:hypothetical protein
MSTATAKSKMTVGIYIYVQGDSKLGYNTGGV